MSVLDQIKQLEEQKAKLLQDAKQEALDQANAAIKTLNALGFNYQLVEGNDPSSPSIKRTATGTRRSGIRQEVLNLLKQHQDGISRSDILDAMNAKGDKKAEQSISNALANAKKNGDITLTDGLYRLA